MAHLAGTSDGARARALGTLPGRTFRIVFLAYVAAVSGFGREFAHLHVTVAGLPVFSGEITIALLALLGAAHLRTVRARAPRLDPAVVAVAAFLVLGCIYAAVGVGRGFGVAALRDFAIVYYAAFFVLTLAFFRTGGAPTSVVLALSIGAAAGAAWTVGLFVAAPALSWGHGATGHQALVAWVAVLGSALVRLPPGLGSARAGRALVMALGGAVIFLSAYRTMLLVMLGVALAGGALLPWRNRSALRGAVRTALSGVALWGVVVLGVATLTRPVGEPPRHHGAMSLAQALERVSERWADLGFAGARLAGRWTSEPRPLSSPSTASRPARAAGDASGAIAGGRAGGGAAARGDAGEVRLRQAPEVSPLATERSIAFRVTAWRHAAERIAASPLLGIGFGPSPNLYPDRHCELMTSPTSNCGNAHNTFLTLAMRMGIPVLAVFLALNAFEIRRALRALPGRPAPGEELLALALAVLLSFGIYASLSLFLESPYLSSLYWIILALMHEVAAHTLRSPVPDQG